MIGEAASLGSAALWAMSTIVVKTATGRLSASFIMAVRTSVATLLVLPLALSVTADDGLLGLPRDTALLLMVTAPLAIAGDLCFVRALALGEVSRVFILSTSLYILLSVMGGVAFGGDTLSWLLLPGGVLILIGSRLVLEEGRTGPDAPQEGSVLTLRKAATAVVALSLLASVLWSAGLLIVSRALEEADPLVATTIRLPVMAAAMVALAGSRGDYARFGFHLRDMRVLALSGVLALTSMLCFMVAADRSDAGSVAVLTSTSPIFVAPLAWLFLKERITRRIAVGTATCMTGIWLAVI